RPPGDANPPRGRARAGALRGAGGSGLLQLYRGAGALELRLQLLGLVLRRGLLDGVRRAVDHVLGLLQAEPGDGADLLDDGDLVRAGAGEHDVELGLLLAGRGRAVAAGRAGRVRDSRSRRLDAVLLLEHLRELGRLLDRESDELFCKLVDV